MQQVPGLATRSGVSEERAYKKKFAHPNANTPKHLASEGAAQIKE